MNNNIITITIFFGIFLLLPVNVFATKINPPDLIITEIVVEWSVVSPIDRKRTEGLRIGTADNVDIDINTSSAPATEPTTIIIGSALIGLGLLWRRLWNNEMTKRIESQSG